jgi:hypothetical protein
MRIRFLVVLQMAALMALSRASYGQSKGYFVEPESMLLFVGDHGDLIVTTPSGNVVAPHLPGWYGQYSSPFPAISASGDRIAWSLKSPADSATAQCPPFQPTCTTPPLSRRYKSAMGVYSLRDKAWKLYGDFCSVGSAAFSPDGRKVAFYAKTRSGNPTCHFAPHSGHLMILDIGTGEFAPVPGDPSVWYLAQLGWSQDGKYLAVEGAVPSKDPKMREPHKDTFRIVVIEIESGDQKVIAEGTDPSWSPKGDWIAYHAPLGQCMLIHPDGTGAKMVLDPGRLRGGWSFFNGMVWSPDGEKLLLNEEQSDTNHSNVTMLDLATGKVNTKFRNGSAVFGWARKPGDHRIDKR